MRIAVVGTGISGALCARLLASRHDVTVFEAADYVGGHTHTHAIEHGGRSYAIDTGFIVCNDWTYPNFQELLRRLDVPLQRSDMSFSVRDARSGFEYCGSTLNALFAQRTNLLRPTFHGMVRDILRFNREAPKLLESDDERTTLGEYLERNAYGRMFVDRYILPMGGAIWSADSDGVRRFPARYFVQFFANHGMLSVDERPTWRVVRGGSQTYMQRLVEPIRERIRLRSPVRSIRRLAQHVELRVADGEPQRFDSVVIAAHSDQALRMLADASTAEREVLGAIPYQKNEAWLHTDVSVLPRRRRAWASWNHHLDAEVPGRAAVTYWMNRLQSLDAPVEFLVTLNDTARIDERRVLEKLTYHHPVYTSAGVAAQKRWGEVNGVNRTWFAGAWWSFGFHEDGVRSALRVAEQFGLSLADLSPARAPLEAALA